MCLLSRARSSRVVSIGARRRFLQPIVIDSDKLPEVAKEIPEARPIEFGSQELEGSLRRKDAGEDVLNRLNAFCPFAHVNTPLR